MEEDTLRQQLGIVDQSLGFLLILIASVLLSFYTVVIQRRGLCLTILGDTKAAAGLPDVYPIKRRASAMVVGSLGFFLCLRSTPGSRRSRGRLRGPGAPPQSTCGPPSLCSWRVSCG